MFRRLMQSIKLGTFCYDDIRVRLILVYVYGLKFLKDKNCVEFGGGLLAIISGQQTFHTDGIVGAKNSTQCLQQLSGTPVAQSLFFHLQFVSVL